MAGMDEKIVFKTARRYAAEGVPGIRAGVGTMCVIEKMLINKKVCIGASRRAKGSVRPDFRKFFGAKG
jgi:hypothetical protein